MEFLTYIDIIEPWQWMIISLLLLAFSILILGDSFLPLVSVSIVLVAIIDYLNFGLSVQFILFSFSLIALMFLAPRLLNKKSQLIAEDIYQMIGQKLRLTFIDEINNSMGKGTASNGKIWNVRHKDNQILVKDKVYKCLEVEGISLIVDKE
jgi:membrane protein implicated in regulation of membrane protease activity